MSTSPSVSTKKLLILKIFAGFLILCLAFELVLRLFGYGHYTIYRPDERLLWVPEPGRTLTVVNHLPITINNQGLRYAVDLQPKQADQFRVISFGDSFAQGWGVDDDSHFSAILEKKLNQGSCSKEHFQSISAGVNATTGCSAVAGVLLSKTIAASPIGKARLMSRSSSIVQSRESESIGNRKPDPGHGGPRCSCHSADDPWCRAPSLSERAGQVKPVMTSRLS